MALYHTHRPQQFSDIVGQEHIIKTIINQIAGDKVAHAYLFSGPRGIGKTTAARLLAKAVNCVNRKDKESEPCSQCSSCEEIASSRAIDVIEIDAASHTGVDNVRENIIENAQFKPTKSKYKVFIIDEVHMLSTSAFNALLKTLEEPPAHVIFILATTELHKLPETIVSRCQRFNFHKVGYDDLKKFLKKIAKAEKIKIDDDVLDRIINKSDGCARDAISLLDQIMATGEKDITADVASLVLPTSNVEETLQFVATLINKDAKSGLELINSLADSGLNLLQFANDTIELLRIMMVTKANAKASGLGLDLNDKIKKELVKLNKEIEYNELVQLIDLLMKRRLEIKSAPLSQLPLEMVVVEWSQNQGSEIKNQKSDGNDTPPDNPSIGNRGEDLKTQTDVKTQNFASQQSSQQTTSQQEEPKTTLTERVKKLVTKEPSFTQKDIEAKWSDFIQKVENNFTSLAFILKMADIDGVENDTVNFSVQYSFHKDKLTEKQCQKNIENLLGEVMDCRVKIAVCVKEPAENKDKQELQELASALGGEVVN